MPLSGTSVLHGREDVRVGRMPTAIKAGMILLAIATCLVLFHRHYIVAVQASTKRCIDNATVFLVERDETTPERGHLLAFRAERLEPIFPDGTLIIKFVDGLPGDSVAIREDHTSVNGVPIVDGLAVAADLGVDKIRFVREKTLNDGEYWVEGRTEKSFDSRYWGPIRSNQIVGRAIVLF